jgi:hypothetical protein
MFDAKLDITIRALPCGINGRVNLGNVVDKDRFFPMIELLPFQSKNGGCLHAPIPPGIGVLVFEGCDAATDFA